jgi:hypothetical protein
MIADDEPMIVKSPFGVEVLVYHQADGCFRVDSLKHCHFVERGISDEKQLVDPSIEIRERRFSTVEALIEAVDREVFGNARHRLAFWVAIQRWNRGITPTGMNQP